jgi:hypothetical protein
VVAEAEGLAASHSVSQQLQTLVAQAAKRSEREEAQVGLLLLQAAGEEERFAVADLTNAAVEVSSVALSERAAAAQTACAEKDRGAEAVRAYSPLN